MVEMREKGTTKWTHVNNARAPVKTTSYTVSNLDRDQEYEFRILAKNTAGLGDPSDSSGWVETKAKARKASPPGIPEVDDITKNSVDLSWAKPRNDGGSPIKGYQVEKRKRGGDWEPALDAPVANRKCTVPNLETNGEYEFRVAAVTDAGVGDVSIATQPTVIKPKVGKF